MTVSVFGFLLIVGCLVARDEMLAAAQKKEFRRLHAAWEESRCPPPEIFARRLPEAVAAGAIPAPQKEQQRTLPRRRTQPRRSTVKPQTRTIGQKSALQKDAGF